MCSDVGRERNLKTGRVACLLGTCLFPANGVIIKLGGRQSLGPRLRTVLDEFAKRKEIGSEK